MTNFQFSTIFAGMANVSSSLLIALILDYTRFNSFFLMS